MNREAAINNARGVYAHKTLPQMISAHSANVLCTGYVECSCPLAVLIRERKAEAREHNDYMERW